MIMDFTLSQFLPYFADVMTGQEYNLLSPLHLMDGTAEPCTPKVAGSIFDAALWSFVAMVPVLISAAFGLRFSPSKRFTAVFLAVSAGMLIALLSYDLLEAAFEVGGMYFAILGFFLGIFLYVGANKLVARGGIFRRNSSDSGGVGLLTAKQREEKSAAMALVIGAALDGIPESMSIGISFLDNKLVTISVIVAVAVANIPEGLASGVGLKRSGYSVKNILLTWLLVVLACVVASVAAFATMRDAPDGVKAVMTALAGGGVLAMTLQTVIPEAWEETHDAIALFAGLGFAAAFFVSHMWH
jgi:ZIP family zinc transporter|tara:strand:+ start:648 stop:1547 length:900 start_codon:yes stop_codon:yes gene_type:complete